MYDLPREQVRSIISNYLTASRTHTTISVRGHRLRLHWGYSQGRRNMIVSWWWLTSLPNMANFGPMGFHDPWQVTENQYSLSNFLIEFIPKLETKMKFVYFAPLWINFQHGAVYNFFFIEV
ncbi:hypothetical protein V2J09_022668 [Rumex salicifolius]